MRIEEITQSGIVIKSDPVENPDGSMGESTWTVPAHQIAKHMRGTAPGELFAAIPKGEVSAAMDVANEAEKQMKS